jgi:hypothetical protein
MAYASPKPTIPVSVVNLKKSNIFHQRREEGFL